MTIVVLAILAILWAVVLLPPLLRARSERSSSGIGAYTSRLRVLGHGHGRPAVGSVVPARSGRRIPLRTARRRRDVVSLLGMVTLVALAGAALSGDAVIWGLFLLSAASLGAYVYAVLHFERVASERRVRVRYLAPRRVAPVAVRRSVGS